MPSPAGAWRRWRGGLPESARAGEIGSGRWRARRGGPCREAGLDLHITQAKSGCGGPRDLAGWRGVSLRPRWRRILRTASGFSRQTRTFIGPFHLVHSRTSATTSVDRNRRSTQRGAQLRSGAAEHGGNPTTSRRPRSFVSCRGLDGAVERCRPNSMRSGGDSHRHQSPGYGFQYPGRRRSATNATTCTTSSPTR